MLLIVTERRHASAMRVQCERAARAVSQQARHSRLDCEPSARVAPPRVEDHACAATGRRANAFSGREMGARIYLHCPSNDETVAIACGFNWGACLLGFIWALSKKMWFAAFVMLG